MINKYLKLFAMTCFSSSISLAMESPWGESGAIDVKTYSGPRTLHVQLAALHDKTQELPLNFFSEKEPKFMRITNLNPEEAAQNASGFVCALIIGSRPEAVALDNWAFSDLKPLFKACKIAQVRSLHISRQVLDAGEWTTLSTIQTLENFEFSCQESEKNPLKEGQRKESPAENFERFIFLKKLYLAVPEATYLEPFFEKMSDLRNLHTLKIHAKGVFACVGNSNSHPTLKVLSLKDTLATTSVSDIFDAGIKFPTFAENYPKLDELRLGTMGGPEGTSIFLTRDAGETTFSFTEFKAPDKGLARKFLLSSRSFKDKGIFFEFKKERVFREALQEQYKGISSFLKFAEPEEEVTPSLAQVTLKEEKDVFPERVLVDVSEKMMRGDFWHYFTWEIYTDVKKFAVTIVQHLKAFLFTDTEKENGKTYTQEQYEKRATSVARVITGEDDDDSHQTQTDGVVDQSDGDRPSCPFKSDDDFKRRLQEIVKQYTPKN